MLKISWLGSPLRVGLGQVSYFNPERTSDPGTAHELVAEYGNPTWCSGLFWFWEQAGTTFPTGYSCQVVGLADRDACIAYARRIGFEGDPASLVTGFGGRIPPYVRDPGCDAGTPPRAPASTPTPAPAPSPAPVPTGQYPWLVESEETKVLQRRINSAIVPRGYCRLTVDGKLGARTCGGARIAGIAPPSTCQSFSDPGRCPASTTPEPEEFVPSPTVSSGTSPLVIAGVAAAAIAAAYFFLS